MEEPTWWYRLPEGDILGLESARAEYPRLFALLEGAGWDETREVAPPEEVAPGMCPNEYSEMFLRRFGGIEVKRRLTLGTARADVGFSLGLDTRLRRLDLMEGAAAVVRLAGTAFVHPVFDAGSSVGFVLEDGRTLLMSDQFTGYCWTPDPFQMLDWILYRERTPGFEMHHLPREDRPAEYWYA
jgi:hypothetical protein